MTYLLLTPPMPALTKLLKSECKMKRRHTLRLRNYVAKYMAMISKPSTHKQAKLYDRKVIKNETRKELNNQDD